MPNSILSLSAKFRRALLLQDEQMIARLVDAYLRLYGRLVDKIDLLMFEYGAMAEPTKAAVAKLARYGDLLEGIESELSKYSAYAQVEIDAAARAAIDLAIKDTTTYLNFYGLSQPAVLPAAAIETLLGFLHPDGALYKRLGQLAGYNTAKVADALLEGIGLGYGPKKVARLIQQYMGGGLTDALRMARTTHLYAYREATRANYIANSDVVQGWIWYAELDGSVCMSCVAMHGSIHPLSEKLDDHYNGRCAMLPYLGDNPVEQSGEAWFGEQSEELQKKMMGGKWDAWHDGKFDFGQLSTISHSDVFGDMRGEISLKDLLSLVE